jgi:hypothetical protein
VVTASGAVALAVAATPLIIAAVVLLSNASLVALVAGTVERVAGDGGLLGAAEVVAFALSRDVLEDLDIENG